MFVDSVQRINMVRRHSIWLRSKNTAIYGILFNTKPDRCEYIFLGFQIDSKH